MKLRLLVKLLENVLKLYDRDGEDRPDMYLPERLLAIGLVMIIVGICLVAALFFVWEIWMPIAAVAAVTFGTVAIMCWKNQSIRVISQDRFEYTTFLGNTYEYRFCDIVALRKNKDSMTLFVGKKKVHIESMAVLSERFVTLVNEALQKA